jgi:hypothetical protein
VAVVARLAGVALATTAITGLVAPGVAGAAQPVVRTCVGTTFSGAAHSFRPRALGSAVRGFARAGDRRPGLGHNIQVLQAGLVPDPGCPQHLQRVTWPDLSGRSLCPQRRHGRLDTRTCRLSHGGNRRRTSERTMASI